MPAGFIYVLINPTMPGLAKVGKTTRNPTDRVAELSSATGVPSPFMLAFQQPVAECDAAELWVHRELEREGHRHADNREFFNAPLHEIIKVVTQSANLIFDAPNLNNPGIGSSNYEASPEVLAQELCNLGCDYDQGTDSKLRNVKKALEYYEQAAALGHAGACTLAGQIYECGSGGVRQDMEKALALYSKAVRLGDWFNEARIAELFLSSKQLGAVKAHWNQFFELACEQIERTHDDPNIGYFGFMYCASVGAGKLTHCVPDQAIVRLEEPLRNEISRTYTKIADPSNKDFAEMLEWQARAARHFLEGKVKPLMEERVKNKEPTSGGWFNNLFK